ncbi:hypothetical protein SEVIR_8G246150v4 [Setaria viridis]
MALLLGFPLKCLVLELIKDAVVLIGSCLEVFEQSCYFRSGGSSFLRILDNVQHCAAPPCLLSPSPPPAGINTTNRNHNEDQQKVKQQIKQLI